MLRVSEGDEPPQILKLGRTSLRGDKASVPRAQGHPLRRYTLVDNDPDTDKEDDVAARAADVRKELAKI